MKGFGKGIGGAVLKPSAGACALPGYAFQGIYKEFQNQLGPSLEKSIIAARTAQGVEDWTSSSQEERMEVFTKWPAIQVEMGKSKVKKAKKEKKGGAKRATGRQEAQELPDQSLIEAPDTAIKSMELAVADVPAELSDQSPDAPADGSQKHGWEAASEIRPSISSKQDPQGDGKSLKSKISRKPVASNSITGSPSGT
ncbi:MAG: hypothetical protein Q9222_002677 [Ikaeria aurantiellina]